MKVGFVGGWGHHTLRGALQDSDCGITAVASAGDGRDNESARAKVGALEGAQWFDDYRRMFDEFKPDVVNIGTFYGHNGQLVVEALERDIRVVCDKPVAADWDQLERVRTLAQHSSRVLITEVPGRSNPALRAARQVIAEGKLGQVVLAVAQKSYKFGTRPAWYGQRENYAGTILWVASHGIDWIRFATGQRYVQAWGRTGNISKPEFDTMEDHTVSVLGLENGATAVVHADYMQPSASKVHGDDRLRIAGSSGVIQIFGRQCLLTTHDQAEQDISELVEVGPVHREIWDAVTGQAQEIYSTQASLELATVLLHAREAGDDQATVAWDGGPGKAAGVNVTQ